MPSTDYVDVKGPKSLAELVAALDASVPRPTDDDVVTLDLGGNEYAYVQFDEPAEGTWPYLITVESRTEDESPVREQATRIFDLLKGRGWELQLTSGADDTLVRSQSS